MPEFTFSNETLEALERILEEVFRVELQEMNKQLERIAVTLEKIGKTKGIDYK